MTGIGVTGATGATGLTGAIGVTGMTGSTGVTGDGPVPSYRLAISTASNVNVPINTPISFTDSTGTADVTLSTPTTITVANGGVYRITFQVTTANNNAAPQPLNWGLNVNGNLLANSTVYVYPPANTNAQVNAEYLLQLTGGDTIGIRSNGSNNTISGANPGETNAYLMVIKIAD